MATETIDKPSTEAPKINGNIFDIEPKGVESTSEPEAKDEKIAPDVEPEVESTTEKDDNKPAESDIDLTQDELDLIDRARQVLTDEEVENANSMEELRVAIRVAERVARQAAVKQAKENPIEPKKDEPPPSKAFKLEINDDDWDEPQRKVVRAMTDHYNGVIDSLVNELTESRKSLTNLTGEFLMRDFDSFVAGLPEEWRKVFGTGPFDGLAEDSEEMQNRVKLYREAELEASKHAKSARRISRVEVYRRALGAAFRDKEKEIERRSLAKELAKRNGAAGSKPGRRSSGSTPASGEEAALAAVKSLYRQWGESEF